MAFDPGPLAGLTTRQLLLRILEQQALNQEQIMGVTDDIGADLKSIQDTEAQIKDALTVKLKALQDVNDAQAATIASMTAADDKQAAQIADLKTQADAAAAATTDLLNTVAPPAQASGPLLGAGTLPK